MAGKDLFAGPTAAHDTSEGPVQLPACYRDASAVTTLFWCEYDRLASTLQGTGLVPARFYKGRGLAILSFYEYRDTSFGPYLEMSLTAAVYPLSCVPPRSATLELFRKPARRTLGYYFIDLPLTAKLPLVAGRELWGLPKFKTNISFDSTGAEFVGKVPDPETGENIITVKAPFGRGMPMPVMDMAFYSNREDSILKTMVNIHASVKSMSGKLVEVVVGPAKHRMVDNLRSLGLDKTRPFLLQTSDQFRYSLNAGEITEDWSGPALPY